MFFKRIPTPQLAHISYMLADSAGTACVIDPRRDIGVYLQTARENALTIRYALETHRHEDFVLGSSALANTTGAKIVRGDTDTPTNADISLSDEQELDLKDFSLKSLATPGHTLDSTCFVVLLRELGRQPWAVFTGDTLLTGSTGRTDLVDSEKMEQFAGLLHDSVHRKLLPLGERTLVFPAHGKGTTCGVDVSDRELTTIGQELLSNPVALRSREDFVRARTAVPLERPPYFEIMRKLNLVGGVAISEAGENLLSPDEFRALMNQAMVIDTRPPESFAAAFIPGSYNVWLESLIPYAGWITRNRVLIVTERGEDIPVVRKHLARIGIDDIAGFLSGGFSSWRHAAFPVTSYPMMSPIELEQKRKRGEVTILDVRQRYEWVSGHIPGAIHAFVGLLETNPPSLALDTPLAVVCGVGNRTSIAVSILRKIGFRNVANVFGGMNAWNIVPRR